MLFTLDIALDTHIVIDMIENKSNVEPNVANTQKLYIEETENNCKFV